MIPKNNTNLSVDFEVEREPSKGYKMDFKQNVIRGYCDGQEAMRQVVHKILNTERYDHIIYSWDYGVELKDLYGEPLTYVCPELQDRIIEALLQDDRITDVTDFNFNFPAKNEVVVTFTVNTIFGEVQAERSVII